MVFKIKVASFPLVGSKPFRDVGAIPNTESELVLSTETGMGKVIMDGYLSMRANFKSAVKLPDSAPIINQFNEAVDLFLVFMAGYGRDNCKQIVEIREVEPGEELLSDWSVIQ